MKCLLGILLFSLVSPKFLFAITQEEQTAIKNGLLGKITYHVLDSDGLPIPNVSVRAAFLLDGNLPIIISGTTNRDGSFSAESKVNLSVTSTFEAPGYYTGFDKYMFFPMNKAECRRGDGYLGIPSI